MANLVQDQASGLEGLRPGREDESFSHPRGIGIPQGRQEYIGYFED